MFPQPAVQAPPPPPPDMPLDGIVTVILAPGVMPPTSYVHHPRVRFVRPTQPADIRQCFPLDGAALIVTQQLPKRCMIALNLELQRRKIEPLHRPNTHLVHRELDRIFGRLVRPSGEIVRALDPPPADLPAPPDDSANAADAAPPANNEEQPAEMSKKKNARGSVKAFVARHDNAEQMAADSARHLLELAKREGISTTFASLAQAVYKHRSAPQSATRPTTTPARRGAKKTDDTAPTVPTRSVVKLLDDAMQAVGLARKEFERMEKENKELTAKMSRAKALMEALA